MICRDISKINTTDKKPRDFVSDITKFIEGRESYDGNILVLYGLRRTGKTTAMEQALQYQNKCAFYEVEGGDTLTDIKKVIVKEKEKGTMIICFDEITKAEDFITNAAVLSDIFAKEGMKIIVTGTDSLGFQFAENSELYDRTIRINTTHIPFAEHSRVLDTRDIDDYIQFGGLMKKGEKEDRIVRDYVTASRYLDSAVAENISRSIMKNPEDNCLECLSVQDLRTIIEKMVELYSGAFSTKNMQNELKKASINYPLEKLSGIADADIINRIVLEDKNIVRDFAKKINASHSIYSTITEEMVRTLEKYLIDMNLLSATTQINFSYTKELGWRENETKHEFYIIQPAIKYYHLQKGKEFIEKEDYYRELSASEKDFMQKKLDEKIKGDMTEQIILFDVTKKLSAERYFVCKPVFFMDGQKKGEYDMLIYDKHENKYWNFEIKHTKNPHFMQEKHLKNKQFKEIIDKKYGEKDCSFVLYRGDSFLSKSNTIYLNITDFLLCIDKYPDMNKVLAEMIKNLPLRDISPEKEDFSEQLNSSLSDFISTGKEIPEMEIE